MKLCTNVISKYCSLWCYCIKLPPVDKLRILVTLLLQSPPLLTPFKTNSRKIPSSSSKQFSHFSKIIFFFLHKDKSRIFWAEKNMPRYFVQTHQNFLLKLFVLGGGGVDVGLRAVFRIFTFSFPLFFPFFIKSKIIMSSRPLYPIATFYSIICNDYPSNSIK